MPSDFWGWIGFVIIVGTGMIGIGALLVIGLFYWWHDKFGIFWKNRNEYVEFTKWREERGIKTPHDKKEDATPTARSTVGLGHVGIGLTQEQGADHGTRE